MKDPPGEAEHHTNGKHKAPSEDLHGNVQPKDGINWFREVHGFVKLVFVCTRQSISAEDYKGGRMYPAHC